MSSNQYYIIPGLELDANAVTLWYQFKLDEAKSISVDEVLVSEKAQTVAKLNRKERKLKVTFLALFIAIVISFLAYGLIQGFLLDRAYEYSRDRFLKNEYKEFDSDEKINYLKENNLAKWNSIKNETLTPTLIVGILSFIITLLHNFLPKFEKHRKLLIKEAIIRSFGLDCKPENIVKYEHDAFKKEFKGCPGKVYEVKEKSLSLTFVKLFYIVPAADFDSFKTFIRKKSL